jgi:DnaK suppressor protein
MRPRQLTPRFTDDYDCRFITGARSGLYGPGKIMDKKKLDTFKKRLEERKQDLRKKVTTMQQDGRAADTGDMAQDIADRAASSYTKEFLFHQSTADRQLLAQVEGALSRIREGDFGQCISCGKEINPKRLEAVPWTRHCIECQEKLEQGKLAQE